jgi:hypothetical protein
MPAKKDLKVFIKSPLFSCRYNSKNTAAKLAAVHAGPELPVRQERR